MILGDGARLFDEIGEHKQRLAGARFRMRLTVEYPPGQGPNIALINGHPATLTATNAAENSGVAGIAAASVDGAILGFETPSLFVATRTAHSGENMTVWTLPEDEIAVPAWETAATTVTPFLQGWLGQRPRAQLTLLDLPDPEDAPFETGALLATAIRSGDPNQLNGILAHALTHAWMQSPRAWLSEGVAPLYGHVVDRKTAWPRPGVRHSRSSPSRPDPGRACKPWAKSGATAGNRHLAGLLPHQGHLCLLDAAQRSGRPHALRRLARL